jgi:transposase
VHLTPPAGRNTVNTNEQRMSGHVVIGLDTHTHVPVAAVIDTIGGILATLTIPTDTGGFQHLPDRATSFGKVLAFGVEGTGPYGATLASFLRRAGHTVAEAGRTDGCGG